VPTCTTEFEGGVARASTRGSADRLAAHLQAVAPKVAALLPGLREKPIDARFVNRLFLPGVRAEMGNSVTGATIQVGRCTWIELHEKEGPVQEQRVLAHELVHYWIGPDWAPLPHFLEEGLADNIQDSVVPRGYAKESLDRVLMLSSVLYSGLVFDSDGKLLRCMSSFDDLVAGERGEALLFSFSRPSFRPIEWVLSVPPGPMGAVQDPQQYSALVSLAYLLVARIGTERLHGLCLRARELGKTSLPPEWVLEAAGLPSTVSEPWNRAILQLYGPVEEREYRRRRDVRQHRFARG